MGRYCGSEEEKIFKRAGSSSDERKNDYNDNGPSTNSKVNSDMNNYNDDILPVRNIEKENNKSDEIWSKPTNDMNNKLTEKSKETSKNLSNIESNAESSKVSEPNSDEESRRTSRQELDDQSDEESTDKSSICAIWQENIDEQNDIDIVKIPSCCHLYHKKWFKDNALYNTKQGFVKCPLCRTEIGVIVI